MEVKRLLLLCPLILKRLAQMLSGSRVQATQIIFASPLRQDVSNVRSRVLIGDEITRRSKIRSHEMSDWSEEKR